MLRLIKFLQNTKFKDLRFYAAISILFLVIAFTQKNIWFGEQSRSDLRDLEEEKIKLNSGRETIEGLARSELGLIKPGEKFYIFEPALKEDISISLEVN
jgi:cell division protein FtsB